jgi:hypothetical protein
VDKNLLKRNDLISESEDFEMDDRRRTISSEEQMIGEALMRVSNTLEAQRLTKSLDYQEKLRSRSNIRLIIAIICLFVAMMMMVISGALLFILWRYADPILDTVMPFLKGMMGDFGVIWDGLVESLSYVPVMVEQLTRLLEQVIIMLEGINRIDLAGLMGYLSKMLGGLMTMMDDLKAALAPMMDAIGNMLSTLSLEGIDGLITDLFGPGAADSIKAFMNGMMDMLGGAGNAMSSMAETMNNMDLSGLMSGLMGMLDGTGKALDSFGQTMGVIGDTVQENLDNGNIENLVNAIDGAIGEIGQGISGNIKAEDVQNLVNGGGAALNGMGAALGRLGEDMNAFAQEGIMGVIKKLLGG